MISRARSKYHRLCADHLHRRPLAVRPDPAVISFTFDDFPVTALTIGGAVLQEFGCLGTYYVSLGLAGRREATGPMFTTDDLIILFEQGHELGCHTFGHCDSGTTPARAFLDSVLANRTALAGLFPSASFRSFSYPKSAPCGGAKARVSQRFECCRGGGQVSNVGTADLNYLRAYFLEQARGDLDAIKRLIDENLAAHGWLIFATHDVCDRPSPFGCTPSFFNEVVRHARQSGAAILPVARALDRLMRTPPVDAAKT